MRWLYIEKSLTVVLNNLLIFIVYARLASPSSRINYFKQVVCNCMGIEYKVSTRLFPFCVILLCRLLFSGLRRFEVTLYMASVAQYNYGPFKISLEMAFFNIAETITSTNISLFTNNYVNDVITNLFKRYLTFGVITQHERLLVTE